MDLHSGGQPNPLISVQRLRITLIIINLFLVTSGVTLSVLGYFIDRHASTAADTRHASHAATLTASLQGRDLPGDLGEPFTHPRSDNDSLTTKSLYTTDRVHTSNSRGQLETTNMADPMVIGSDTKSDELHRYSVNYLLWLTGTVPLLIGTIGIISSISGAQRYMSIYALLSIILGGAGYFLLTLLGVLSSHINGISIHIFGDCYSTNTSCTCRWPNDVVVVVSNLLDCSHMYTCTLLYLVFVSVLVLCVSTWIMVTVLAIVYIICNSISTKQSRPGRRSVRNLPAKKTPVQSPISDVTMLSPTTDTCTTSATTNTTGTLECTGGATGGTGGGDVDGGDASGTAADTGTQAGADFDLVSAALADTDDTAAGGTQAAAGGAMDAAADASNRDDTPGDVTAAHDAILKPDEHTKDVSSAAETEVLAPAESPATATGNTAVATTQQQGCSQLPPQPSPPLSNHITVNTLKEEEKSEKTVQGSGEKPLIEAAHGTAGCITGADQHNQTAKHVEHHQDVAEPAESEKEPLLVSTAADKTKEHHQNKLLKVHQQQPEKLTTVVEDLHTSPREHQNSADCELGKPLIDDKTGYFELHI